MSYFNFDGASYITTPTFAAVQLTGDIDVRATVRVPEYTGEWRTFISTSGARTGYHFRQSGDSPALEAVYADGTWRDGTGNIDIPVGKWVHGRVTVSPGDAFRFMIDTQDAGSEGCNANPGRPETSTDVCVGAYIGGATTVDQYMVGDITYAEIRNGIDGPVVLVFDANDPNIPADTPDGASWTDANGLVWTVHGDGITHIASTLTRKTFRKRGDEGVYLGNPTMRTIRR
jgi:hypothetical protein